MSDDNVTKIDSMDTAAFRVPASDAKGHSVPKGIRMMPVLANAINILMASGKYPYKHESELMRHAIMRHIRWLEAIGDVPSVSGQASAANAMLNQEQMNEEYKEIFNRLHGRVNDLIRSNDHGEARRLVSEMRSYFDGMPEGFWKRQYQNQIEEFNWLYENAPKANLLNFSSD